MTAYMPQAVTDDWATPRDLFDRLNERYNFDLDAAASSTNHLCDKWFGLDHPDESRRDGLTGQWDGEQVWINPPYGRIIEKWVAKAYAYSHGHSVTMLLPARTDTRWFHDYIYNKSEITFIKGRLKFGQAVTAAPFPSMIVRMQHK